MIAEAFGRWAVIFLMVTARRGLALFSLWTLFPLWTFFPLRTFFATGTFLAG